MKVKVQSIAGQSSGTSKSTGKPYTVTTVVLDTPDGVKVAETLGKVEVGQEYEGELTYNEKFQKWSFKKDQSGYTPNAGGGRGGGRSPQEIQSIEMQSARRDAVEVVKNYYAGSDEKVPADLKEYCKKVAATMNFLFSAASVGNGVDSGTDDVRKVQEVISGAQEVDNIPTQEEVDAFDPSKVFDDL